MVWIASWKSSRLADGAQATDSADQDDTQASRRVESGSLLEC
jgi:hypothetical protein